MMKSLSRIALAFIAVSTVLLLAAGCGGTQKGNGGDGDKKGPEVTADAGSDKAPDDLGMAKDSTVLAEDGAHLQLASAWLNTHAVLVFLRGHW